MGWGVQWGTILYISQESFANKVMFVQCPEESQRPSHYLGGKYPNQKEKQI